MPNVKIELEKGMTPDEAEELVFKAFQSQRTGDIHQEKFMDPAMTDLVDQMERAHKEQYQKMVEEIGEALDEEYKSNGLI